jgi:serine/threonine-protein kinase
LRRFRFYAELQEALEHEDSEMFGTLNRDSSPDKDDKDRLGAYYVIDWVLAHGASPFTAEEAVAASRALSVKIAPTKELAATAVGAILRVLVRHEFLEEVSRDLGNTIVPEASARQTTQYRLTARRRAELGHLAAVYEDEHAPASRGADAVIGRYHILNQIGSGGYGSVFRAEDSATGRIVAVKVLNRALSRDPDVVARFMREAKILQSLRHPNIVPYLDVVADADKHAIVMELIDGMSVSALMAVRERLPLAVAVEIFRPTAEAIGHLHKMSIARADLKPGNILVRADGHVFVTDFGIAKPVVDDDSITREGMFIGTPRYVAPEQFSGDSKADARSDIWSLGIVLYAMLTGSEPFTSESMPHLIMSIFHEPFAPIEDAPVEVNAFIDRCLRKNPEDRFQTIEELFDQLKAIPIAAPVHLATFVSESMTRDQSVKRKSDQVTAVGALDSGATSQPLAAAKIAPPTPPPSKPASMSSDFNSTVTAPLPRPIPYGEPYLEIIGAADLEPRILPIPREGRARIGRAREVPICIQHPSLTRYHAEISATDIRDLNSSNGTFVNEKPVRDWTKIADGDEIRLGVVVTKFHTGVAP